MLLDRLVVFKLQKALALKLQKALAPVAFLLNAQAFELKSIELLQK
jgi:hypothetical protein